jgi:hypothetical protein
MTKLTGWSPRFDMFDMGWNRCRQSAPTTLTTKPPLNLKVSLALLRRQRPSRSTVNNTVYQVNNCLHGLPNDSTDCWVVKKTLELLDGGFVLWMRQGGGIRHELCVLRNEGEKVIGERQHQIENQLARNLMSFRRNLPAIDKKISRQPESCFLGEVQRPAQQPQ